MRGNLCTPRTLRVAIYRASSRGREEEWVTDGWCDQSCGNWPWFMHVGVQVVRCRQAGRTTTTSTSTGCRRGYSCTQAKQRPRTAGQSCCWPSSRQPDGAYDSELVLEPSASASLCSVLSRCCRKHTCSIQVYCRVAVLAEGVAVRVCPEWGWVACSCPVLCLSVCASAAQ